MLAASQSSGLRFDRAADCGAGIGRVSKHFLLKKYSHVDLVEQSPRLLQAAPEYIGKADGSDRISLVQVGLQVNRSIKILWACSFFNIPLL